MRAIWAAKQPNFIDMESGFYGIMQIPYFTMLNGQTVDSLTY